MKRIRRTVLATIATLALAIALIAAPAAVAAQLPNAQFADVSCPSATLCYFVGSVESGDNHALIETWNNHVWNSRVHTSATFLSAVSCVSTTRCVAVGTDVANRSAPYAETLTSGTWMSQVLPHITGHAVEFSSISCTSNTRCVAIGEDLTASKGITESLSGSTWTLTSGTTAVSVSCVSATKCISSTLADVSCTSSTSCVAVDYNHTPPYKAIAQTFDGSHWHNTPAVPVPSGTTSSDLAGVSCVSASSCVAIGDYTTTTTGHGLGETWNGSAWTRHSVPTTGGVFFQAVSCAGASACVAAGYTSTSTTAAEIWNGSAWSALAPH